MGSFDPHIGWNSICCVVMMIYFFLLLRKTQQLAGVQSYDVRGAK